MLSVEWTVAATTLVDTDDPTEASRIVDEVFLQRNLGSPSGAIHTKETMTVTVIR